MRTALTLHQQGQLAQAEALYLKILQVRPDHGDACHLLGAIALQRNQPALALEYLDRAVLLLPGHADAHSNRGNALSDLRHHEEALACYDRAIALRPDHVNAHNNRGSVLRDLKRLDEALASYDRAISLNSEEADAHNNRGNLLRSLKRLDEALASYDRAIRIKPDHFRAHNNRGNALLDLRRLDEALASYDRAITLKPDYANAHSNRGNVLRELQRRDEALASFDRAIALNPNHADAHSNRGNLLRDLNRLDEATASLERAIRIMPDHAEARWNDSLVHLLMGEFDAGWKRYECRWNREPLINHVRGYSQPLWLGDADVSGRRILLWPEQGFGDSIQFCRYAARVADLGAEVILEAPRALTNLFRSIAGVSDCVATGAPLPQFDFHTPLLSLPLALGTRLDTIPAEIPYLYADPERVARWHGWLGPCTKPRIGLAWSGSATHLNDHNRSLPFARLAPLIDDRAEFICLQKEMRDEDDVLARQHPTLRIVRERLTDFAETAALIDALDLVITVDTSVAHLAGAMGKEVWVLLHYAPDWRWMLERDDSPWYPSARLIRQARIDQWEDVIVAVRRMLDKFVLERVACS